jgi:hypothetical protein
MFVYVALADVLTFVAEADIYSPTFPEAALSFVVVPTMPVVVGLKVIAPEVKLCPHAIASPEVEPFARPVTLFEPIAIAPDIVPPVNNR